MRAILVSLQIQKLDIQIVRSDTRGTQCVDQTIVEYPDTSATMAVGVQQQEIFWVGVGLGVRGDLPKGGSNQCQREAESEKSNQSVSHSLPILLKFPCL